jgi:hypothetical protein
MAALLSSEQVVTYIKNLVGDIEVFDEFPSDPEQVRSGIYVNDPAPAEREPYRLGIQTGSSIYTVTDAMRILLISFQGDNRRDQCETAISGIVANTALMSGYHERDYTMEQQYINRAEYRTYDFSLKRIEIN